MKTFSTSANTFLIIVFIFLSAGQISGQDKNEGVFLGKANLYKAKKNAIEYLNDSLIIKKFGIISDAIWNYAELGMQEFKSSAILIKTLEEAGFKVEKGVAGIPTCFVGTWGSGKNAHAAVAPWTGRSALDGVELMDIAANYLREHLFYTYRLHYVITEGGEAPNVVPDKASVWYYIRNTDERIEEMYQRVLDCAKVMAATALDLFTRPKLLDEIKKEFEEYSKEHPYKSFLPEGAKPPLNLNKELMDKYRDAMATMGDNNK